MGRGSSKIGGSSGISKRGRKSSSENKNNVDILKSIKEGWQMGRQTGEKINEYDERLRR